jgi:hypothetical protein
MKYDFFRKCEGEVTQKSSNDLEEFKDFCHYSALSNWKNHKALIELCLKESGTYALTGNDVKYFIIEGEKQHG